MPRGYELTSYYDSLRAMFRKIYSKEIKRLSSAIKNFGYLNNNLYGLVISSVNSGLEDYFGELTQYMYHFSGNDIGVNQSSRLQDFMSPLELRANALAIKRATNAIYHFRGRVGIADMQRVCYEAGQSVALEYQSLKICQKGEFKMSIDSPVLSTTPIIKKYDKSLKLGTYPKGDPITYSDRRQDERKDLILSNKKALLEVKQELLRIGLCKQEQVINAFQRMNLGYYFISECCGSVEPCCLLFDNNFDSNIFYHTELCMNLEKLTMAKQALKTIPKGYDEKYVYSTMYNIGLKARDQVIATYKMLPEMFSGFYNIYSDAERVTVIRKDNANNAKKIKNGPNKDLGK